jgi:hypothetical protein
LTAEEWEEIDDWLDWARAYAERLDPTSDRLPTEW